MLPLVKKTDYVNRPKYIEGRSFGYDLQSTQSFDPLSRRVINEVNCVVAKSDYFPNTDWKDNELSVMIPAGVDPGSFSMLKRDALSVGDGIQSALDIVAASGVDDIVEQ